MHILPRTSVVEEPQRSGSLPISQSKKVLLRREGGGCGREIPRHSDEVTMSSNLGKILCGMESGAMPGLYFVCSECLHGRY